MNGQDLHRSFIKWFIRIYIVASLALCAYALTLLTLAWKSAQWPAVSGIVKSSQIIGAGKNRKPEITYAYRVNGRVYHGSQILVGPDPMGGGIGILTPHEYVRKYTKGKVISVHYDPEAPHRSVLEPGINRIMILLLLTGSFFLLLGVLARRQLLRGSSRTAERFLAPKDDAIAMAHRRLRKPEPSNMDLGGPRGRFLGCLTLLVFFGLMGYAFWPKYQPLLVRLGILESSQSQRETIENETVSPFSNSEENQRQEPHLPEKTIAQKTAEARKRAEHEALEKFERLKAESRIPQPDDPAEAERITVFLARGFAPINTRTIPGRWRAARVPFSDKRPSAIVNEPLYQGRRQLYGDMQLGTYENNRFCFSFDQVDEPHPVLYLDKNQNGDLADDGGPLQNQGSGRFAIRIELPFARLVKELESDAAFVIWFYLNEHSWENGYANFYSRTQLKGRVRIGNESHLAYISEWKHNDADFTNDGIYIDLNSNGKIDMKTEFIAPGQVVRHNGRTYGFDIQW